MKGNLQTISWDNSVIYSDFNDPKILADIENVKEGIRFINSKSTVFEKLIPENGEILSSDSLNETIPLARDLYRLGLDMMVTIQTLATYSNCSTSTNSLDYVAKDLSTKADQIWSNIIKAMKPLQLFILRAPEDYLTLFLQDEKTCELHFSLKHSRQENDFLLGVSEEILLEGHSLEGLKSWGKLYTDLAGSMKIDVNNEKIGLAQASNLLMNENRDLREKAYRGINSAWQTQEISAGAILNSINGWRLENNRARSGKRELHYLDKSCHQSRISRDTLNALMQTTYDKRHIGQEALRLMAREMGVEKLGPWDVLAPNPTKTPEKPITFPEAMEIIQDSFKTMSPDMADFAKMMMDKKWIDCAPSQNRAQGAYCTRFSINREPRVFMTYEGNMKNVVTLAHELGHAYHNWVMRDLKLTESAYSMTLAETASIFAETLVRDTLIKNAKNNEEKKKILWQELESAAGLMINIPMRFEFEKNLVELKKTKTVTVPELKKLMTEASEYWYGDTLSEHNEMFWASKLHFSIPSFGFYNYPYLFGYLFSLGIYAKKSEYGSDFSQKYISVLRDTGIMTAEDLITKHFNEDISKGAFWEKSLNIINLSVEAFRKI